MEARFGGKAHEWDSNDWTWDGDLFIASRINSAPSDCRSKQVLPVTTELPANAGSSNNLLSCFGETTLENENGKRELEKRRVVVVDDQGIKDEAGFLNLKLGRQIYPITEEDSEKWEKSGKKTKVLEATSSRVVCQVDNCRANLSCGKDYHRRHKVCDIHSKASSALVGNVMQRFCQQCSRFHVLQEFDDGKRSCRRRLAGHNKRRRKNHPDSLLNGRSLNKEQTSSYLLTSLLRILSNMHNSTEQTKDQDLLSHLLSNLASLAGTVNESNLSGLLQGSQDLFKAGSPAGTSEKVPASIPNGAGLARPLGSASRPDDCADTPKALQSMQRCMSVPAIELVQKGISTENAKDKSLRILPGLDSKILFPPRDSLAAKANAEETNMGRMKLNSFDLNNVYNDSQDCVENLEKFHAPSGARIGAGGHPLWVHQDSHKTSPPQTSGNSCSTSSQSLSSSTGEIQSRTDRIVFKLFGKNPNDFPLVLRTKILDWLSYSPTDIESYIRPGCITLTIYLRMNNSKWEEICCDLGSSLRRLLNTSGDTLWSTGWAYVWMQHHASFIYNGQVVMDTPLPPKRHQNCRILSIKPVAVPVLERAQFVIKGFNLVRPTTRLLCLLEGQYLVQESCYDLKEAADTFSEHDGLECLRFPCCTPDTIGRGFIEVEDHGLSSSFFPFIVAEADVCSEICTLEDVIEVAETLDDKQGEMERVVAKNQALDFIHEMGWLLHRSRLRFRLGSKAPHLSPFSFNRFKWLMEFSMDHDWCAVVKKLLGVIFSGTVDVGERPITHTLLEMGLLHKAVQRNCRSLVELLLKYLPDQLLDKPRSEEKHLVDRGVKSFIFKPDVIGPGGLTPLHIAASKDGSIDVLDALTDDPGLVGIESWKSARDSTGLTPYEYACVQGHDTYINLVQEKINKRSQSAHVVLDIPGARLDCSVKEKASGVARVPTEKIKKDRMQQQHCLLCKQNLACGSSSRTLVAYRPATLSMVAIAGVCVCVALLLRSLPANWPQIRYGSM